MKKSLALISALVAGVASTTPAAEPVSLTPLGTVKTGVFRSEDPRAAEINAYDAAGRRIYVVNPQGGRLDIIDASIVANPVDVGDVDVVGACQAAIGPACTLQPGAEPNSVAIHGDLMAVALGNVVRTDNGHAVFFELRGTEAPKFVAAVEAGALPDMIVFTEDGKYALTADEGEPNTTYTIDPPGTVSIIDVDAVRGGDNQTAVRKVGFDRFDSPGQRANLDAEGVRIFGPGASVAQDLEPEYIAVRRNKAYVTLQENNALAIINIAGASVEKIVGLGLKDHSLPENGLDASDQDNAINIRAWPISGLYQPDAIDVIEASGKTYLIMANEGDAREYAGYVETLRLNSTSYVLDPSAFPNAAALKANTALGRLNVTTASGDVDGDGDYDRIDVLGGRSISIRDHQGNLVWDSNNAFELLSRQFDGTLTVFNTTNTANSRDNRSDDKGIEPESVVVGDVHGRLYAFVGLERDGGIVVIDVTEPTSPVIVNYVTNRKLPRTSTGGFQTCSNTVDCGDLGPEGLTFVPASKSPTGTALLLVSNEVSSTTTIWAIDQAHPR